MLPSNSGMIRSPSRVLLRPMAMTCPVCALDCRASSFSYLSLNCSYSDLLIDDFSGRSEYTYFFRRKDLRRAKRHNRASVSRILQLEEGCKFSKDWHSILRYLLGFWKKTRQNAKFLQIDEFTLGFLQNDSYWLCWYYCNLHLVKSLPFLMLIHPFTTLVHVFYHKLHNCSRGNVLR